MRVCEHACVYSAHVHVCVCVCVCVCVRACMCVCEHACVYSAHVHVCGHHKIMYYFLIPARTLPHTCSNFNTEMDRVQTHQEHNNRPIGTKETEVY